MMTDTTTQTATTATTADSAASTNSEPTNQPQDKTEPSSSTPAAGSEAPAEGESANKDSTEAKPAQGEDKGKTDDSAKEGQASDDDKPKDADKADEGKDKEEKTADAQPIKYEPFQVPEGMAIDNDALNEALPVLQELKVPQDQAQKLVDVASSMISKVMKNVSDQHNTVIEGWRKETTELFGKDGDAKFQERTGRAEEVVKQFFNEEQRKVLTAYGLGNHPGFFGMALAIAEGTQEDRLNLSGQKTSNGSAQSLGDIWYGDNK